MKNLNFFNVVFVIVFPLTLGTLMAASLAKEDNDWLMFNVSKADSIHVSHELAGRPEGTILADRRLTLPEANDLEKQKYFHSLRKEGWKLVWQEEFEANGLDRNKWTAEKWAAEKNNELQYYHPENIKVRDGQLQIISKAENYGGRKYTSGAIHTKEKFSFQYGKVEMRAKLPSGQGIFPAFWLMPETGQTWLPEIDILEMVGHKPDEIWMVLHWMDDNDELVNVHSSYKGPDFSGNFHTFGIEWSPERITWFIDGKERFTTAAFIPEEEMYLYLNTAIGGDWPGDPDETTLFPQYFKVDYVRVYTRD